MHIHPNRTAVTTAVAIALVVFLCAASAGALSIREKLEEMDIRKASYKLDVEDKPFGKIAIQLQGIGGLNILPGQFTETPVTLKLDYEAPWQVVLEIILKQMNADIHIVSDKIIEIVPSTRLIVEKADLRMAIFSLARASGKNVIIDPDVEGPITLTLEGVPFEDALNAMAEAGGYKVVKETENLYRIASPHKLITQLVTRRITLKYLWPEAPYRAAMDSKVAIGPKHDERYAAFAPEHQPEENFTVLKALKKMLTVDPADPDKFIGHIEYIPNTNTLVITDVKPKVDEITAILREIDRMPYQIMIDVKFVTTTNTDFFEFGIDFTHGLTAMASGASTFIRFPFSQSRSWFTERLSAFDAGTGGRVTGGTGLGTGSFRGLFLDPDQDGGADRIPYTFGSLDFSQLQATLRLMKSDEGTEITQRPQILTLNNKEATIFVGTRVRFAQTIAASNQQGGLTFSIEEAESSPVDTGFQLLILPRVIEGEIDENGRKAADMIMMTVIPESRNLVGTTSEIPGFNKFITGDGAGGILSIDLPEIATSSLVTNMILRTNQTAVVGGLITKADTEMVRQVPFFSRIPLLGYLMKSKVHSIHERNLLIFITPRIVYSETDVDAILARELHRNRQNLPRKYPEDSGVRRTFDIERVYDVLYGRPNPYDKWREYDEMPPAKTAGDENIQPTEPEEKYAPEDAWNDRPWNDDRRENETHQDNESGTMETREPEQNEPVNPEPDTGLKESESSEQPWEDGTEETIPPVAEDSEDSDESAVPAPAEESASPDERSLPEKERDESSTPSSPEDQPTEKESFGQLNQPPSDIEETDAEDTEPEEE